MTRVEILLVVEMNSVVTLASLNSRPVIGSSVSSTVRCFVPRSCMKSPRTTVTAPFAKPTATWDRSRKTAKAETGKGFLPFVTATVQRQRGMPVFLSGRSNAQTFSTGSLGRSSARVMSSDECGIWRMVVNAPESWAFHDCTVLKD